MSLATGAPASAPASSNRRLLADDAPWRAIPAGNKPLPLIHQSPVLRVPLNPSSAYALQVMKHPNPIREGLAMEARLESAGPDCIVPGQTAPVKLLGLKVWPIDLNLKFMEPVASIGKFMDSASNNIMKASTIEER
ncbi:hypothetical protein LUZ60_001477 [Juncus effusus]|nr:hypothetical protein LUZ60_001477 [Juncus effusus]